ncbi:serine hydrolase domain-containing protein [Rhizohabitans arisaemae]|uniref:serine hydrolase domain-containing protein n=1 Tax=Rhizohabitans arisaemae TaxID=2720610 RepID=UPI0024B09839|nr:serine hydrolase domain-containing protein [Rhizohabitans arisaemae]
MTGGTVRARGAGGGELGARLTELADRHGITGAAVAFSRGDVVTEAATGVLNTRTGYPAGVDSLFQVGSIAKVWTATLVMQLVAEGRLRLDQTVRSVLPGFALQDEEAAASVTIEALLTHTAGFEGDVFADTGRGDDAVERLVALLAGTPQLFRPGAMWSYNNAGYCVLGRIVEVLRGTPYGTALHTHIAAPLGLTHIATCADEAILYGTAVGHAAGEPLPVWSLMRSNEPAGSSLAMRARDLLDFARTHLRGGLSPDGVRLLPEELAPLMREPRVDLPDLGRASSWGLGWELRGWEGGLVAAHGGTTPGHEATLLTVPGADVAAVLLTNGGDPGPIVRGLLHPVIEELAGVRAPVPAVPPAEPLPVDAARYTGRYLSDVVSWEVAEDGPASLRLTATPLGATAEYGGGPQGFRLLRLRGDTFAFAEPRGGEHSVVAFVGGDRIGFLHTGRANPRVA